VSIWAHSACNTAAGTLRAEGCVPEGRQRGAARRPRNLIGANVPGSCRAKTAFYLAAAGLDPPGRTGFNDRSAAG
jgi:hypothetical protein